METKECGFSGFKMNGFLALFLHLVVLTAVIIFGFIISVPTLILSVCLCLIWFIMFAGYMELEPNEARAMVNISPRHRVRRAGREQEYDVLAWANGSVSLAIVVEVKSRVRREAIAQLESQLNTLPEMLPEIASKSRIGILAGVDWDAGVREEAQAAGLYTASIHDEIFALTTPEGFAPRRW
jgi:hypothetical protein